MNESVPDLSRKRPALALRSRVFAAVRAFFLERGYLEVETPVRVPTPALEDHIDAEPAGDQWLRTSPELHMKRLVCAGYDKIFQMGPCFRQGERGQRHRPEYTMLEWYRAGADVRDLETETHELLAHICGGLGRREFGGVDLAAAPVRYTVRDAFWLWAGWDPLEAFDAGRFDLDLVEKVEPRLAEFPVPVIFTDFPKERAALARIRKGAARELCAFHDNSSLKEKSAQLHGLTPCDGLTPYEPFVAERWELYLGGMELANAYHELTDSIEQRARFEACAASRAACGQAVYPLDELFLEALDQGMPDCAGIALGLDRLLMVLAETGDIADVRAFG